MSCRHWGADVSASLDLKQLLAALRLQMLTITPEIALLSRSDRFLHGDTADLLIGTTALQLGAPLITADANLRRTWTRRPLVIGGRSGPSVGSSCRSPAPGTQADIV